MKYFHITGFFVIFCTICSQFWCKEHPEFLSFRISILGLICQSLKAYLDHGISIKAKSTQNFGNISKMARKALLPNNLYLVPKLQSKLDHHANYRRFQ